MIPDRYVASRYDLGPARGPRAGILWHMAEGFGTVAYLANDPARGVSVHYVVEQTGRVTQMLPLDHMHSSVDPSSIRETDDDPYTWHELEIRYGRTAAAAVLGDWRTPVNGSGGPNHASIGIEVEGFAADGPNDAQLPAIAELAGFLEGVFPSSRPLGHRDLQDYKACPGHRFPWELVGGHGTEELVSGITFNPTTQAQGAATMSFRTLFRISDGAAVLVDVDGYVRNTFAGIRATAPVDGKAGNRQDGYLVTHNGQAHLLLATDATWTATGDAAAARATALEQAEAAVAALPR